MDALVALFPKSGGSWLCAMTSDLGFELKYSHLGSGHVRRRPFHGIDAGRIRAAERFVVLFRDPRDLVVSGFHQCRSRAQDYRFKGSMREFIVNPNHGIEKVARFHLAVATACVSHHGSMALTYESLQADAAKALQELARFLGRPVSPEAAEAAARANTLEQMQRREADEGPLRRPEDPNSARIRRGIVGSHLDELSSADVELCDEILTRHDYWPRLTAVLRS